MKSKRLGCLSANGLFSLAITLLVFGGVYLARGGLMFSPGPLSASTGEIDVGDVSSHAETGNRCSACHTPFWRSDTMSDRCLDCHTEVQAELSDPTSFHGIILSPTSDINCRDCHTEHQGPTAELTTRDTSGFPHQATGYSLDAHAHFPDGSLFGCRDCHADSLMDFDQARCSACHQQIDLNFTTAHLAAFGRDCLACHDGLDSYGAAFDHRLTDFPLEGQHASSSCNACHEGARTVADLQTTALDCYACHANHDVHQGAFGQTCSQCHTPDGWEQATFNHNLTGFILLGKHIETPCLDCHERNGFGDTPRECFACHATDDIHEGRLGEDCGQCHISSDWSLTSFNHDQTAFPLTGAHRLVVCTQCHTTRVFQGAPQDCAACHNEPAIHTGLFENTCENCHTTEAWLPAQFDLPHTFPTNHGRREASSCQTCHPDTLYEYTCYSCHEHSRGEIAEEHREEGITNFQNCIRCHPTGREDESDHD